MMKKTIIAVVVIAVAAVAWKFWSSAPKASPAPQAGESSAATSTAYAMSEIAAHAGRESCWTAIDGKVYDVTSFIPAHPGGEERILSICGKDGSAAFNGQHGESERAQRMLQSFSIGTVK